MIRRLSFTLAATALLSGCSTMGGPEDLFGYATPQPGVLASAPGLTSVQPLPPAPDAPRARGVLPAPAPAGAAPAPAGAAPISPGAVAPASAARRPAAIDPGAAPIASSAEDDERERMIAAALAPASGHQSLGELDRNGDGTLILPAGRSLEIIDISPIRSSMRTADDL